jgi:hypothetical protein
MAFTGYRARTNGIHYNSLLSVSNVLLLLVGIYALSLQVIATRIVYFQIESEGLRCRQFRKTRFIRWSELTRVTNSSSLMGGWSPLELRYLRSAPESTNGKVQIEPKDREALIARLREHAPLAQFEV